MHPDETADPSSAAERFADLDRAEQLDLDSFFREANALTATAAAEVFRLDFERRWLNGERVPAERYMHDSPSQIQPSLPISF